MKAESLKQNKELVILISKVKDQRGIYNVVAYDPDVVKKNDISNLALNNFLRENECFDSLRVLEVVYDKAVKGIPKTSISSLSLGIKKFILVLHQIVL